MNAIPATNVAESGLVSDPEARLKALVKAKEAPTAEQTVDAILAVAGATLPAELHDLAVRCVARELHARIQSGVGALSYSEKIAIGLILLEIPRGAPDGRILVMSDIADRAMLTRSVIVNALRKLESAGLVQSRSLGMKGTLLKVLVEEMRDQFD